MGLTARQCKHRRSETVKVEVTTPASGSADGLTVSSWNGYETRRCRRCGHQWAVRARIKSATDAFG